MFLLIAVTIMTITLFIAHIHTNNYFKVNKQYDKWLNNLMDNEIPLKEKSYYTICFKDTTTDIWVQNYPYSYGRAENFGSGYPSMKTRKRLAAYIASH